MSERLDVRGLSCPQPVLVTRTRLNELGSGRLEVMADTGTARDNVSRVATGQGWKVEVLEEGDDFLLVLSK